MSKQDRLLAHLRAGKTVTGLQAIKWWGLYRLSSAIHNLRSKYAIDCEMVKRGDTRYGRYSMGGE